MDELLTAAKTIGALAVMVSTIFFAVWGATGSAPHGWHALKRYGMVMGVICAPVFIVAVIAAFTG